MVLSSLILSQGPDAMVRIEEMRRKQAQLLYERTYSEMSSSGVLSGVLSAGAGTASWASFSMRSFYSAGLSAEDAALSVVGVQHKGEELRGTLPSGLENRFFTPASIRQLNEGTRNAELQEATNGVMLLVMTYPVSIVAVWEGVMELLFGIAAFFLLISLPISLVFSFFLPTEGVFLGILKQYGYLLMYYMILNMLIAMGMSGLVLAAGQGSVPLAVGGSVFSMVFYAFGLNLAKQSAMNSFTALSGGVAQTMGFRDPTQQAVGAVKTAGGLALGAAGAGLALAAGAPMLAPSLLGAGAGAGGAGSDGRSAVTGGDGSTGLQGQGWQSPTLEAMDRQKSWVRAGLGWAGGRLMKGTPFQGPATSLATMKSRDIDIPEAVQAATGADAALVGLTAGGRSFFDDFIVMDRISRRARQRMNAAGSRHARSFRDVAQEQEQRLGSADGSHQQGPQQPQQPAPPAPPPEPDYSRMRYQTSSSSPWKRDIHEALNQYGEKWGHEMARAISRSLVRYLNEGLSDEEIRARFLEDGEPSLQTAGAHQVFRNLPEEQRETLRTEAAQAAMSGMIGEAVMPRTQVSRDDLARAIADAVRDGFVEGQGAEAVARQLGTSGDGLGHDYGVVNRVADDVARSGLSPQEIEITLATGEVFDGREDLARNRHLLPDEITFRKSRLDPQEEIA
jgi:hypothetical protein